MDVTGWKNASWKNDNTKLVYGIHIPRKERDHYFKEKWPSVTIEFKDGGSAEIKLKGTFWETCNELRSPEIRKWFFKHNLVPWPKDNPPHLKLELIEDGTRKFKLSLK
jgi:hypothetical protein